ncbi:PKD domain-containing protein [Spirosoma koreense]
MGILPNLLKRFASCLLVTFSLISCKNDDFPVIRFSVDYVSPNESNTLYRGQRPTYIPLKIRNVSFDADTYKWDFGNGSTSTEKEPVITYKKSGVYTITVTATNSTGRQQTSTRSIKIVDRVLKQVTIQSLNWNAMGNLPNWPASKTADLQLVLGKTLGNAPPLTMSTVLFESNRITNVNTTSPITIPITQKIVIDPYEDVSSLVVNLFGYDPANKTLVYSGGGFSDYSEGQTGLFVLMSSFGGTTLRFESAYE